MVPGGATPLVTHAESALVLLHSQAIERVTSQTDCLPAGTLGGHECAQHGEGYAQPAEHHDQPVESREPSVRGCERPLRRVHSVGRPLDRDERERPGVDALTRVLAETGQEPALAKHMPNGAVRWRPKTTSRGTRTLRRISRQARAALERYLRTHPRVGDVWIFPQSNHPDRPTNTLLARHLLVRAEARAELPRVDRGAFHAYRRLFASERKHLPDVDLMRTGGWRDLATMKRSYQQADPATTLRVIENEPETREPGHTSDTPSKASSGPSTA